MHNYNTPLHESSGLCRTGSLTSHPWKVIKKQLMTEHITQGPAGVGSRLGISAPWILDISMSTDCKSILDMSPLWILDISMSTDSNQT